MMYSQQFVVCIKSNNAILRDNGGQVRLKFDSEYSILLKNLSARKAKASVSIDGTGIGSDVIVYPNTSTEIDRFLVDTNRGHRFRFIKKTDEISKHRGDRVDDGLVRVEFDFEAEKVPNVIWYNAPYIHYYPAYTVSYSYTDSTDNCAPCAYTCNTVGARSVSGNDFEAHLTKCANDPGITVPGSESNSKWHAESMGIMENCPKVIVISLLGLDENAPVAAVTVKTKLQCPTCGKNNNSANQYCGNCGTALFN